MRWRGQYRIHVLLPEMNAAPCLVTYPHSGPSWALHFPLARDMAANWCRLIPLARPTNEQVFTLVRFGRGLKDTMPCGPMDRTSGRTFCSRTSHI